MQTNPVTLSGEEVLSKTINYLRLPLIILVVLAHGSFSEITLEGGNLVISVADMPIYSNVTYLIFWIFASSAVPLFYTFSGFLFFYKVKDFNKNVYFKKLKKRVDTLLVPYVFWNLLVLLFFYLLQTFFPSMTSGDIKPIAEYSALDWLNSLWSIHGGQFPMCYQLWFIRDLIVIVIFSPIIYLLVKYGKVLTLLVTGSLWILNLCPVAPGFNMLTITFFTFGAYLSINKINFVVWAESLLKYWVVVYLGFIIVLMFNQYTSWSYDVINASAYFGVFLMIGAAAFFMRKGVIKENMFFANSSFFVYAYHGLFLAFITKVLVFVLRPNTDFKVLALYFLCVITTVGVGIAIYWLLNKLLPRFTGIITGNR